VDVEVICIGNELLIGKIENTNAYWLAKQITALGANVKRVTVIQDVIDEIASCILEVATRKPRFIITTGGLGPTFDDKTFQGIAKALNQKLEVNQEALEMVKQRCVEYFEKRGLSTETEMTPPRVKMATFPSNTQPIINPIGTAPALRADLEGMILLALPGVPAEVEAIVKRTIAPLIKDVVGASVFCERSVFTENIAESHLAPLIDQVMNANVGVYVKSHPMRSYVELHLTIIACQDQQPAEALLKAAN
jgi:molybdenum cofactor synthesis domain-containing protein